MGANAQTSVPAFTAGQVLTSQQQTEINTGIPVFATTTTRDAAFGGTGEKVLAEGQFAYIESSNATQYYDGAAWQTVGGGLTLIKTQTIGSAVSSVAVTGVFSSSYDNYKVIVAGGSGSTNLTLNLTLGATATGYYYSGTLVQYTSSAVTGQAQANQASMITGYSTSNGHSIDMDIQSPNLAARTAILTRTGGLGTGWYSFQYNGFLDNATQYTDFTLTTNTGTITGGTIRVYGYQNS